jgi:hypothetical protein
MGSDIYYAHIESSVHPLWENDVYKESKRKAKLFLQVEKCFELFRGGIHPRIPAEIEYSNTSSLTFHTNTLTSKFLGVISRIVTKYSFRFVKFFFGNSLRCKYLENMSSKTGWFWYAGTYNWTQNSSRSSYLSTDCIILNIAFRHVKRLYTKIPRTGTTC